MDYLYRFGLSIFTTVSSFISSIWHWIYPIPNPNKDHVPPVNDSPVNDSVTASVDAHIEQYIEGNRANSQLAFLFSSKETIPTKIWKSIFQLLQQNFPDLSAETLTSSKTKDPDLNYSGSYSDVLDLLNFLMVEQHKPAHNSNFELTEERLKSIFNHQNIAKLLAVIKQVHSHHLLTNEVFDALVSSSSLDNISNFLDTCAKPTRSKTADSSDDKARFSLSSDLLLQIINPNTLEHLLFVTYQIGKIYLDRLTNSYTFMTPRQMILEKWEGKSFEGFKAFSDNFSQHTEIKAVFDRMLNDPKISKHIFTIFEIFGNNAAILHNEQNTLELLLALEKLCQNNAVKQSMSLVLNIFLKHPILLTKEHVSTLLSKAERHEYDIFKALDALPRNFVTAERFETLASDERLCKVVSCATRLGVLDDDIFEQLVTHKQLEDINKFFYAYQFFLNRTERAQLGTNQGLTIEQFKQIINPKCYKNHLLQPALLDLMCVVFHEVKQRITTKNWDYLFNNIGSENPLSELDPDQTWLKDYIERKAANIFYAEVLGKNSTLEAIEAANQLVAVKRDGRMYPDYPIPESIQSILIPALLKIMPSFVKRETIESVINNSISGWYFRPKQISQQDVQNSEFYSKYMRQTMRMDLVFFPVLKEKLHENIMRIAHKQVIKL